MTPLPRVWRVVLQDNTVIVATRDDDVTKGDNDDVTRFNDVINFTPSNETCDKWPHWHYYWSRDKIRLKFTKYLDRASHLYRVQIPATNWATVPRDVKFEMDITRDPLEVLTQVDPDKDALISVRFWDNQTQPAGGVQIKLGVKPRYSLPGCHKMKPLGWRAAKLLSSLPVEKVRRILSLGSDIDHHIDIPGS